MNFLENVCKWKNHPWTYIVMTLIVFLAGQALGSIPLILMIYLKNDGVFPSSASQLIDFTSMGIDPNVGLILMLIPFIVSLLLFILLIKPFNGRSTAEVINGTNRIRWNRFYVGFGIIMLISAAGLLISYYSSPENFEFSYNPKYFWPLVLISVLLFPLQSSFEEIFFRGYLAQGVGIWTKSRWLVLIIPSILFALMHGANPEVQAFGFWTAMGQYLTIALLFAVVSILDDGIELAMGMHSANNAFLAIFLTHKSSAIQTNALFTIKEINASGDLVFQIVYSVILVFALGRFYSWDWKILTQRIKMNCAPSAAEVNSPSLE